MLENSANNGQVIQILPNQLKQLGYSQAQSKAQITQLLQSNLWYSWNEAEGCFERWSFYTEDSFFVETKAGKKHYKWAFMEHTDLLVLQTETENPKLVSAFVDFFAIEMYFLGLAENMGLDRPWFILPNYHLEKNILGYSLKQYSQEYKKLIQPFQEPKEDYAEFFVKTLPVLIFCILGAITKDARIILVYFFTIGVAIVSIYRDNKSKEPNKRAKAGFVEAYQNPKIKL